LKTEAQRLGIENNQKQMIAKVTSEEEK